MPDCFNYSNILLYSSSNTRLHMSLPATSKNLPPPQHYPSVNRTTTKSILHFLSGFNPTTQYQTFTCRVIIHDYTSSSFTHSSPTLTRPGTSNSCPLYLFISFYTFPKFTLCTGPIILLKSPKSHYLIYLQPFLSNRVRTIVNITPARSNTKSSSYYARCRFIRPQEFSIPESRR